MPTFPRKTADKQKNKNGHHIKQALSSGGGGGGGAQPFINS